MPVAAAVWVGAMVAAVVGEGGAGVCVGALIVKVGVTEGCEGPVGVSVAPGKVGMGVRAVLVGVGVKDAVGVFSRGRGVDVSPVQLWADSVAFGATVELLPMANDCW